MDWLLRQARLKDGEALVDLAIQAGHIAAIGPNLLGQAANEWDLRGKVVLPGLIDAHTHLGKTYTTTENQSGTLLEAIDIWRQFKRTRTPTELQVTARRAIMNAVANGVTAIRSHVDIEVESDLAVLEALLDLREQVREIIDLQFVTLGGAGGSPERQAVTAQAMTMGADLVGGAPSLTADPQAAIDATFVLAERCGKPIDLHIDETEDPQMLCLEYLAEQTIAHGMVGQVTAGHCCSLAFVDPDTASRVLDKVAQAGINIITLPSCNLVLMGRGMQPTPRGITPVKAIVKRGINISAASDNVHDPFNPFGSYDLLQIANLNAHVAQLTGEAELYDSLVMVTTYPAQTLGLTGQGLVEGAPADLVVVDTNRVLDAVLSSPPRLATFKAGRLIVRTTIERDWSVK
jgi:cytosine deaminase